MQFVFFAVIGSIVYAGSASRVPEVNLEEYNALRSFPDSPNQPRTVPLSFFTSQLQDVVQRAIDSAPEMSGRMLVATANERPAKVMDKHPQPTGVAVDVAVLTEESSNNPWNIFRGREIFRLCASSWYVRSHVCRLVIVALVRLSFDSIEERLLVSRSVGFEDFARGNPQWIVLTFAETFDQVSQLLDSDFHEVLGTYAKPLDWEALEGIRTGAAQIMDATSDDDILVFIGNSASYYHYALAETGRRSYLLPFSGGWRDGDYEEDPSELPNFEDYERVFLDPIRREAQESGKTILLADITIKGRSIEIFDELLRYRRCETCRTEVIQILHQTGSYAAVVYSAPGFIAVRALVHPLNGSIYRLLMGEYTRLVPNFSPEWWYACSEGMMAVYASQPVVFSQIARIRNYVGKKGLDWPHKNSPLVDVAEYLELRNDRTQRPFSLPLYYWTADLVDMIRRIRKDVPVGQGHLLARPRESLAQVADRLDSLESEFPSTYLNEDQSYGDPAYFNFAEWAAELIDLSRQHEYLRETIMPPLTVLAESIPELKDMIRSAFGDQVFTTTSPPPNHF